MDVAKIVAITVLAVLAVGVIAGALYLGSLVIPLGVNLVSESRTGRVGAYGEVDPIQSYSIPIWSMNALAPGTMPALLAFLFAVPAFTIGLFVYKVATAILA